MKHRVHGRGVCAVMRVVNSSLSGKFGNTLDAKASKDLMADFDADSDTDSDTDMEAGGGGRQRGLLAQKKKEECAYCINHSVTEPCVMQTMDRGYGFIPITGTKPCIYTVGMFEDFRKRHFHSNILNRINDDLVDILRFYQLSFTINCYGVFTRSSKRSANFQQP